MADHGRVRSNIGPQGRPPRLNKRLVIRVLNGQLVLQSWPRKRGSNQTPAARYWVNWLTENMRLWNNAPVGMRQWYRDGTKNLPAKAPDGYMQIQRGRWGLWLGDLGWWLYPLRAWQKVSSSLDVITNVIGALLVRGNELWEGINPGNEGDVLTAHGIGLVPTWEPLTVPQSLIFADLYKTSNQTVPNITPTNAVWAGVTVDTGGFWNAIAPDQLVAPRTGWYEFGAYIHWPSFSDGQRTIFLQVNGTQKARVSLRADAENPDPYMIVSTGCYLTAGDVIVLTLYQSTGVDQGVVDTACRMWISGGN